MKTGTPLFFLIISLLLLGCSEDSTDKKAPKPETSQSTSPAVKMEPAKAGKPPEPYPNSPTSQDLHPDTHVSGVQSNHASGAIFSSDHLSGQ